MGAPRNDMTTPTGTEPLEDINLAKTSAHSRNNALNIAEAGIRYS